MKRLAYLAMALTLVLLLPACGIQKKAADTVISAAETAYDPVKEQAMNVAPDSAKVIEDAIAAAKADVEKGDYKTAILAAKDLPAKVKELSDSLPAKQAELQKSWEGINASVPGALAAIEKQVGAMRRPPAGMDKASFEGMKTSLADLKTKWGEAETAMQGGKWVEAVTKGDEVKTGAAEIMTACKMPLPEGMM